MHGGAASAVGAGGTEHVIGGAAIDDHIAVVLAAAAVGGTGAAGLGALEVGASRARVDDAQPAQAVAALHGAAVGAGTLQAGGADRAATAAAAAAAEGTLDGDVGAAAQAQAVAAGATVVDAQGVGDGDAVAGLHRQVAGAVARASGARGQGQCSTGAVGHRLGGIQKRIARQHQIGGRIQQQMGASQHAAAGAGIAHHQVASSGGQREACSVALGPDLADLHITRAAEAQVMVAANHRLGDAQQVAAAGGRQRPAHDGGVDHRNGAIGGAQAAQLGNIAAQVADRSGGVDAQRALTAGQHLGCAA